MASCTTGGHSLRTARRVSGVSAGADWCICRGHKPHRSRKSRHESARSPRSGTREAVVLWRRGECWVRWEKRGGVLLVAVFGRSRCRRRGFRRCSCASRSARKRARPCRSRRSAGTCPGSRRRPGRSRGAAALEPAVADGHDARPHLLAHVHLERGALDAGRRRRRPHGVVEVRRLDARRRRRRRGGGHREQARGLLGVARLAGARTCARAGRGPRRSGCTGSRPCGR